MSRTKLKARKLERLADYPKPYRDALAYFEAFRRFGFGADEIFFGFGVVDYQPDMVHLQLQTQGKTFTVVVGELPGARRALVEKTWRSLAALMNSLPPESEEWREHVWKQHVLGSSTEYFAMLAAGIQGKGIIIPELLPLQAIGDA